MSACVINVCLSSFILESIDSGKIINANSLTGNIDVS